MPKQTTKNQQNSSVKFIIPGRLDGLNEYTKANRTNIYSGAKLKKENEQIVIDCILYQRVKPVSNPVFINFYWFEPNKRRDKDNIASAKKFILDALVKASILPDDGWKYIIGFSDSFDLDKQNPRIEVEITEIPPAEDEK